MGDPKKQRKKYAAPLIHWERARIEEEAEITKKFGLKNKKEIWKINALLRKYTSEAKRLITLKTPQAIKEQGLLMKKLQGLGLLQPGSKLDHILDMTANDIMGRRLQTIVHTKGLARTITQARQMITHGHIFVGKKKVTLPSYFVMKEEEGQVTFDPSSSFASIDHPERKPLAEKPEEKEVLKKKTDRKKNATKTKKRQK